MVLKTLSRPLIPFLLSVGLGGIISFVFLQRGDAYATFTYGPLIPILLVTGALYGWSRRAPQGWYTSVFWLSFGVIALNAPGSLYFHQMSGQYDRLLHFGVAFLAFPISMLFQSPRGPVHRWHISYSFVLAGLVVFEGYQWLGDQIFAGHSFFDRFQSLPRDVTEDIFFGAVGLFLSVYAFRRALWPFGKTLLR